MSTITNGVETRDVWKPAFVGQPLKWRCGGQPFVFFGGPYVRKPKGMFGVCLLEHPRHTPNGDDEIWLPIPDFETPNQSDAVVCRVLAKAIRAAAGGKAVYIGCAGGKGRTGLFLALLMKALGVRDPIGRVRKYFHPHAVETPEQEDYVRRFDVTPLRWVVFRAGWRLFAHVMFTGFAEGD